MTPSSSTKDLFFEDLARSHDFWIAAVADALTKPTVTGGMKYRLETYEKLREAVRTNNLAAEDVRPAVEHIVRGVLHSVLCVFDGSTALWEKTTIDLCDSDGNSLGGTLALDFLHYLERTGRNRAQAPDLGLRH